MTSHELVLIQVAVALLIAIIMIYKRIRYRITPLNFPIIVVIFALIRALLDFLYNPNRITFDVIGNIHFIFYGLAVLTLYLFGETIIKSKFQILRISLMSSLFGIFIGMYFSAILFQDTLTSNLENCGEIPEIYRSPNGCNPGSWPFVSFIPFYELALDIFQTLVFLFLAILYLNTYFKTSNKTKKTPIIMLFLSMMFFLSVGLIELGEHFFPYEINAWFSSIAAFLLLGYVYSFHFRIAYVVSTDIYRLSIVLKETGIPIFEVKFTERELFDITVVASLGLTLNETFKELTSTEGNINSIKIDTSQLSMHHTDKIFCILESETNPYLLKTALKDFTINFERNYAHIIDSFKGQQLIFDGINEFLTRYFPTIKFEDQ